METDKPRTRGRPPIFGPGQQPRMIGVHWSMTVEICEALREYSERIRESSISYAARTLLGERLVQLGYLKGHEANA